MLLLPGGNHRLQRPDGDVVLVQQRRPSKRQWRVVAVLRRCVKLPSASKEPAAGSWDHDLPNTIRGAVLMCRRAWQVAAVLKQCAELGTAGRGRPLELTVLRINATSDLCAFLMCWQVAAVLKRCAKLAAAGRGRCRELAKYMEGCTNVSAPSLLLATAFSILKSWFS